MYLYKLVEREGNRFIVQDSDGDKLRRKLKVSEMQVVKQVVIKRLMRRVMCKVGQRENNLHVFIHIYIYIYFHLSLSCPYLSLWSVNAFITGIL